MIKKVRAARFVTQAIGVAVLVTAGLCALGGATAIEVGSRGLAVQCFAMAVVIMVARHFLYSKSLRSLSSMHEQLASETRIAYRCANLAQQYSAADSAFASVPTCACPPGECNEHILRAHARAIAALGRG